ncbi:MAG: cohesin domain-containing protein [Acidobacteriota bacterium]|nr:cohesin domain-containing protein [Acidobacteriota bacterium]
MRADRKILLLLVVLAALGCSGYRSFREAQIAERRGDWDQAVLHYLELVDQYPGNISYKAGLLRSRIAASQEHFDRAKKLHEVGALEQARKEYLQTLQLDPSNQYAQVEFEKVLESLAAADGSGASLSIDDLKARTKAESGGPPVLNPRSNEPISLNFPNKVSLRDIYRALGQAFGINIQFDSRLRDKQMEIELEEVTAQEALEFVMKAAGHFYKVLNETTIIVIEDNTQNRREYEEQVIQTFFLSNAEVKEMLTLLRSLVGTKNIASNDQLNAIVLRDSADAVKVAERIISANDKARGEVVVDVELLQINTSKMRELGVELSQYSVLQNLDQDPPLRVSDLEFLNQQNWEITLPGFIYNFVKTSSEAQLLASPQIRISDGEQANLTIGDRVPIPVTTFNSQTAQGGGIVPITSFQYQDVGIRLELEPRIHHNNEITLTIQVEVSSLAGFNTEGQPTISTRNIQSTIRLKDGETNFLAGLIRSDETSGESGVPGLSDIPILGRFFSKKSTDKRRTDLVLTLTPHIIRRPDITGDDLRPLWVGTEGNLTFRGGSPRVESEVEGPFDEDDSVEENERIRDLIRRRIESLPQGLRDEAEPELTPGVDLVPATAPSDPFADDDGSDDDDGSPRGLASLPGGGGLEDRAPGRADPGSGELGARVWGAWAAYPQAGDVPVEVVDAGVAAATPPVRLSLATRRAEVEVGAEVEVVVRAQAAAAVSHLPMTLRFDPGRLEVVAVDRGDFLGPQSVASLLSDITRPGHVMLGPSRLGDRPGVAGEGDVARIRFRPLREGEARIRFADAAALDRELGEMAVAREGLALHVVPAGTLPPDEREWEPPVVDRPGVDRQ